MMYEFKCDNCNHEFVCVLSIKNRKKPLAEPCSECGEKMVQRVYSISNKMDSELLKADKRMESSGVQQALERIRDNHTDAKMKWKG